MVPDDLKKGTWLLTLSGGPDSVALFHMMRKEGVHFACAHVNYRVRSQADEEEAYARRLCGQYGVECHVKTGPFSADGNFEASAREIRYAFFEELVHMHGYEGILTGHQMDDLLETWLMQKEKDLIPETYGIAEVSTYHGIPLVRPLLAYTKQQLQEYCDANGYAYWIDASNADERYTRNRLRHSVLADRTIEQKKDMLEEVHKANEALQQHRQAAHRMIHDDRCDFAAYRLESEDVRLLTLFELYREKGLYGFSRRYYKEIDKIIMRQDDFVKDVRAYRLVSDHTAFFLIPQAHPYADIHETVRFGTYGSYTIAENGRTTEAVHITEDDLPLTIRSLKAGDAIRMRFGTKKVSRFFIDRHIPLYLRSSWPIVVNAKGEVILVPGLGCSYNHYATKDVIYVIQSNNTEEEICGKTTTLKKY